MYYNKTGFDESVKLFNKDIKEAFLAQFEGNTLTTMQGTLMLLSKAEQDFDKDMFEMNEEEFTEALRVFKYKSLKSGITRFSALTAYDLWCYDNGYTNGRPPVTSFFSQEDLEKYIHHVDNFMSYDEIMNELAPISMNYQDIASALLAFEGVKGQKNCELTLLRKKDVHFDTNTIDCRDENDEVVRSITVRDTTMELVKLAINETEYKTKRFKESGEQIKHELPYNDYVFRQPTLKGEKRSREVDDPISWSLINGRIKNLAVEAGRPFVTTSTLFQSGMLYKVLEIEEEKGFLTVQDYKEVVTAFGNAESTYFSLKQLYLTRFNTDSSDKI